ncbi:MAG: alkaline phosphatase D family protein, partial [bacterium]
MRRITIPLAVICTLIAVQLLAKPPIKTPEDTPLLGELDPYLLETLYKTQDKDAGLESIVDEGRFRELVEKHDLALFGGPMLGCVTPTSARIWVRTPGPAEVWAVVAKAGEDASQELKSDTIQTTSENDYTALLDIANLSPFSVYRYNIVVDGEKVYEQELPEFRTYPTNGQKAKFTVGFGGGARYVPENEKIWDVIASYSPDAFLFLGDNVYIDLPKSRTKQRVHYYRRQLRREYRHLTESTSIYAIYDDHDFGKDDCYGGPEIDDPAWKIPTWNVFTENWNNPYYGGGENQPGCWFDFYIGDVHVIMLDGRYYRDKAKRQGVDKENPSMLGEFQLAWLKQTLKNSKGTFKILASPVPWMEGVKGGKGRWDTWDGFNGEREEIYDLIAKHNIPGVVLLSADRHRTDVYRIERPNSYDFYEFETSRLTNRHKHGTIDKAIFSYNKGHFFGLLTFDLTKSDPEVTFECITMDKKSVYDLT